MIVIDDSSGGSRHLATWEQQHVADQVIRLFSGNLVSQHLTFISSLEEGGPKSIAKLDGGAMTGFASESATEC